MGGSRLGAYSGITLGVTRSATMTCATARAMRKDDAMMRIVHTIKCDYRLVCTAVIEAVRPVARAAGWNCDTRLGIDFCPTHAHLGSKTRERGTCAFCGKSSAIKNSGLPVYHDVPGVTPVVRCPGIHQQVIRGS